MVSGGKDRSIAQLVQHGGRKIAAIFPAQENKDEPAARPSANVAFREKTFVRGPDNDRPAYV